MLFINHHPCWNCCGAKIHWELRLNPSLWNKRKPPEVETYFFMYHMLLYWLVIENRLSFILISWTDQTFHWSLNKRDAFVLMEHLIWSKSKVNENIWRLFFLRKFLQIRDFLELLTIMITMLNLPDHKIWVGLHHLFSVLERQPNSSYSRDLFCCCRPSFVAWFFIAIGSLSKKDPFHAVKMINTFFILERFIFLWSIRMQIGLAKSCYVLIIWVNFWSLLSCWE